MPDRLSRDLGTLDAVVVGLGAMLGAGIFAVLAPAAASAGSWLLVGLAVAAVVAYCNATSSARLAARYPASGGTYVYGRQRLGPAWGFVAGWGFVVGKTASCAAMALTFGTYVRPDLARPLALGAVVGLTALNLLGVRKTALLTRLLVAATLSSLVVVVAAALLAGGTEATKGLAPDTSPRGLLQAAGLIFFAFAGYARIATLGEEVRDPRRAIPRAIPIALGLALVTYAVVAGVALHVLGAGALSASDAPLVDVVEVAGASWASPLVRAGAAIASLGVLLSLLVGVSRTAFAMGADGALPRWLGEVEPSRRVPRNAELVVAAAVLVAVAVLDLRGAIGFSSFLVLTYYAIANASAWTLRRPRRQAADATEEPTRTGRAVPAVGFVGCVLLAFSLPVGSVVGGAAVVVLGLVWWGQVRGSSNL